MAVKFGLPFCLYESRFNNEIAAYLSELATDFELVLVNEYYDKSLVLMKILLGWTIKDII